MENTTAAEDHADLLMRKCNGRANRALFVACTQGRPEVAAYLIRHLGADVNNDESFGRTPLDAAVDQGHIDVARLLVKDFGADVAAARSNGVSVLHVAASRRNNVVQTAAQSSEVVRVLVTELGASVEARTAFGSTPLPLERGALMSFERF